MGNATQSLQSGMTMKRAKSSAARSLLAEAPLALEFLNALDVARVVCVQKRVVADAAGALWFWINTRMQRLLPHVGLPLDPPSRAALQPRVLLVLLRRLHAVSTYAFDVRFDPHRRGGDVYLPDDGARYVSHWGATGGSMFGDRACPPWAVSYWECEGLSEGSYLGVAAVVREGQPGFRYYGLDAQHLARTLSLPSPACDHMPAVMYCESGFITSGAFRGPKLELPARVRILEASPFLEGDRVGVVVDRVEGFMAFACNGQVQTPVIPISVGGNEGERAFVPVFSACTCYNLRLVPNATPPWSSVYHFRELRHLLWGPDDSNQLSHELEEYQDPVETPAARGA